MNFLGATQNHVLFTRPIGGKDAKAASSGFSNYEFGVGVVAQHYGKDEMIKCS